MKYTVVTIAMIITSFLTADAQVDISKADKSNTWFKVGLNTALPITDLSETHNFGIGADISLQFLETKASGIGVKAGYLNYFSKSAKSDVGALPLAIMYRFYPESKGWFAGLEVGYAFLSGLEGTTGGYFIRPQVGIHNDNWNYFAYYDHITIEENGTSDLMAVGIGVTYNVRIK